MFMLLAIILGVAWLLGFAVFNVASLGIHLLVVLAIISMVLHLVRGRRIT